MEKTRILYRKLSLKSKLQFGQFADHTVQELINIRKFDYLRWVYYCQSNIDFLQEVKDAIGGIPKDIEKPGTDVEFFRKWQDTYYSKLRKETRDSQTSWEDKTEEEKLKIFKMSSTKKKRQRIKKESEMAKLARIERAANLTASQLQGMNHGHGYSKKRDLYK